MGRHGPAASDLLPVIARQGAETVPGTDLTWAELPWLADREKVVHLDDLLLRRTRLGLTLPQGGEGILAELEPRLRPGLGWSPEHWRGEVKRYMEIWRRAYSPRLIQRPDKEK
jgi:glycerol-3-phosphate dehydrogenase